MHCDDEENLNMHREDKILNNAYNTGNIDYEQFTSAIKIDERITHLYKDVLSENIVEERTLRILDDKMYEFFTNSPYYEKYRTPKRVDKNDLLKMFYYFKEKLLKEKTFSEVQIFMGFAEFFQVNYSQLYAEIKIEDKEGLLKELDEKFNLNKKIKINKLF
jgi:hypothetical protein